MVSPLVAQLFPFATLQQLYTMEFILVRTSWSLVMGEAVKLMKQNIIRQLLLLPPEYDEFSTKSHILVAGTAVGRCQDTPEWEPDSHYRHTSTSPYLPQEKLVSNHGYRADPQAHHLNLYLGTLSNPCPAIIQYVS